MSEPSDIAFSVDCAFGSSDAETVIATASEDAAAPSVW